MHTVCVRMIVMVGFGRAGAGTAELGFFKSQALLFGAVPVSVASLSDQFLEMGLFVIRHPPLLVPLLDGPLDARKPRLAFGGAGGAERRDQMEVLKLHSGGPAAAAGQAPYRRAGASSAMMRATS